MHAFIERQNAKLIYAYVINTASYLNEVTFFWNHIKYNCVIRPYQATVDTSRYTPHNENSTISQLCSQVEAQRSMYIGSYPRKAANGVVGSMGRSDLDEDKV